MGARPGCRRTACGGEKPRRLNYLAAGGLPAIPSLARCRIIDAPVAAKPVEQSQLRSLTQRFWRTAHGFWTSDQRRVAWTMTASLIGLIVLQTFIAYRLNVWNRNLFDDMEN